ncbi:transcription elongation factor NusA [Alkalispirochaeta sphaeroplastigenens]|uniref:Transcription termination/antitermination protein NusA n=1 Tax=Alkalispirochaeta sphaeroplastigenens TaxID=1187066 RepID=A0A2S4JFH0_9SPIO|nr:MULTISPECIES: transcription termination factor NusA [Alkalispirochaeta]POQ98239.1 transcription elongation factor NusA [Alkalispirochaeta sphaeroplastigenens]
MATGLADAIRAVVNDKGISEELLISVIEDFLLAAYKRTFGHDENAVVQFSDDGTEVTLYAQKKIVDDLEDEVTEISLEDALLLNDECEVGDELLIEINPQDFDRVAIQTAKQRARQRIREIQKDTLYSEFIDKVGELVIGYVQRERNGNVFIDLGKAEGILPKRYQSPREIYRPNDRIKALIVDVAKSGTGLQIALSRTHTDLVKRIFEIEVPEIYGKTVEIVRIVREAGYRTKIAVASNREDVDPVGACVGLRGVRIQAIVRELEGEKIDILKYDSDPRMLIKNALSPAEVSNVIILDEARRQALAVVPEEQLSLAIGKQGLNVRLANRLADWNIDVKTPDQLDDLDLAAESKRAMSMLFGDSDSTEEEITDIAELPGISQEMVTILKDNDLTLIEEVVGLSAEDLGELQGMTPAIAEDLGKIIADNVEIVEQDASYEDDYDEEDDYDDYDDESEDSEEDEQEDDDEEGEIISSIAELPGITGEIIEKLRIAGIVELEELITLDPATAGSIEGLDSEEAETIRMILTEFVEIVEPEDEAAQDE